jgi:hypothetical protein
MLLTRTQASGPSYTAPAIASAASSCTASSPSSLSLSNSTTCAHGCVQMSVRMSPVGRRPSLVALLSQEYACSHGCDGTASTAPSRSRCFRYIGSMYISSPRGGPRHPLVAGPAAQPDLQRRAARPGPSDSCHAARRSSLRCGRHSRACVQHKHKIADCRLLCHSLVSLVACASPGLLLSLPGQSCWAPDGSEACDGFRVGGNVVRLLKTAAPAGRPVFEGKRFCMAVQRRAAHRCACCKGQLPLLLLLQPFLWPGE